jgi:hypothetical protein
MLVLGRDVVGIVCVGSVIRCDYVLIGTRDTCASYVMSTADRWGEKGVRASSTLRVWFLGYERLLATAESVNMPQAGFFEIGIQNAETEAVFEEYRVTTAGNKTECYVESRSNVKFSIFVKLHVAQQPPELRNSTYRLTMCVDGMNAARPLMGQVETVGFHSQGIFRGKYIDDHILPFVFGNTVFSGITEF